MNARCGRAVRLTAPISVALANTDDSQAAGLVKSPYTNQEMPVQSEPSQSTVYFDGSCALCRAEIGYYRRKDQAGALCFVDVSDGGAVTPTGVSRERTMQRFHVRAGDGRVLSGAAAFVEVWSRLPYWRWAARAASLPGALAVLELGYRLFLPVRPVISRFLGQILRRRAVMGGVKRG